MPHLSIGGEIVTVHVFLISLRDLADVWDRPYERLRYELERGQLPLDNRSLDTRARFDTAQVIETTEKLVAAGDLSATALPKLARVVGGSRP